jgi:hypothetical protein
MQAGKRMNCALGLSLLLLLLSQGYQLPLLPPLNVLPVSMFLLEGCLNSVRSYFQLSSQVRSPELLPSSLPPCRSAPTPFHKQTVPESLPRF